MTAPDAIPGTCWRCGQAFQKDPRNTNRLCYDCLMLVGPDVDVNQTRSLGRLRCKENGKIPFEWTISRKFPKSARPRLVKIVTPEALEAYNNELDRRLGRKLDQADKLHEWSLHRDDSPGTHRPVDLE